MLFSSGQATDDLSQRRVGLMDDAGTKTDEAFRLRDGAGFPLLARAFPVVAADRLLVEAVHVMATLGEGRLLFCSSST